MSVHIDAPATSRPLPSATRRFKHWTTREVAIVREHYVAKGAEGCLPLLPGRTMAGIYAQAVLLELKRPRKKHARRWPTNEQIDKLIRETYENKVGMHKKAVLELAQLVGRPRWWVSKRALALGLVPPRFKEPEWTAPELAFLEANAFKSLTVLRRGLEKRGFKRSESAIQNKRKRYGCDCKNPNHFTATAFSKLMGIDVKGVTAWIAKGWLKARKRGTDRTESQGGDMWWIRKKDARRFIIDNATAVDLRKVDKFWFIDFVANGPRVHEEEAKHVE